ncbi:hypothetical protein GJ654_16715 [Rhodoblastus acidophilus]|uniref:Uncharacterized protein n=1 Tax=Rhodoblastus acidophilus TaxID=1074 RepID=A0A6N8DPY5_RHOAC|nr:hypothetical protein [Rhodoblastus acidophilus]MCW2275957.1 hypothetical protein [Rhodoblastus acidophilus]MTV32630.1 hypothetical protein [Rhodoblastus acidophilus]
MKGLMLLSAMRMKIRGLIRFPQDRFAIRENEPVAEGVFSAQFGSGAMMVSARRPAPRSGGLAHDRQARHRQQHHPAIGCEAATIKSSRDFLAAKLKTGARSNCTELFLPIRVP